jgi:predicted XRE-type DNA-binding protein
MLTSTHKLNFQSGRNTKKQISSGVDQKPQPEGRLPRITKMMALAIRLDHLIKSGQVTDQAEIARVGHVSRARLTQIMDLNLLAPDIQEELLFLVGSRSSIESTSEQEARNITKFLDWKTQRQTWQLQKSAHS